MHTNTFEIRRENLRQLVLEKFEGNRAALARQAEVNQNQINLFLTDNEAHRRNLGEALARKIEVNLGLTVGWLDSPHGGATSTVKVACPGWTIPDNLKGLFRREDRVAAIELYSGFVEQLAGKITAPENLLLAAVASRDLEELAVGELVILDVGVKAISSDGIYVLQRGDTSFLRRVAKQLSGGWLVHGGGTTETLDSLKSIKAAAKVVMVWRSMVV